MFSTVRCCLEWQRVQPEQPHRVDLYQPPLSLDRGLNCFQIFRMLYATISFAFQRYMCNFFFLLQCACEASSEKVKRSQPSKYLRYCWWSQSISDFVPLVSFVFRKPSLFISPCLSSPLPCSRGGRGAEKCQLTCKPNVQLFKFEKNRKQNIILCVHFHMHVLKLAW